MINFNNRITCHIPDSSVSCKKQIGQMRRGCIHLPTAWNIFDNLTHFKLVPNWLGREQHFWIYPLSLIILCLSSSRYKGLWIFIKCDKYVFKLRKKNTKRSFIYQILENDYQKRNRLYFIFHFRKKGRKFKSNLSRAIVWWGLHAPTLGYVWSNMSLIINIIY